MLILNIPDSITSSCPTSSYKIGQTQIPSSGPVHIFSRSKFRSRPSTPWKEELFGDSEFSLAAVPRFVGRWGGSAGILFASWNAKAVWRRPIYWFWSDGSVCQYLDCRGSSWKVGLHPVEVLPRSCSRIPLLRNSYWYLNWALWRLPSHSCAWSLQTMTVCWYSQSPDAASSLWFWPSCSNIYFSGPILAVPHLRC